MARIISSESWRSVGTIGGGKLHTFENDTGPDGANHAQNGMILWRPAGGIAGPAVIEGAKITDVAPTILSILGQPVPSDMEGEALSSQERGLAMAK